MSALRTVEMATLIMTTNYAMMETTMKEMAALTVCPKSTGYVIGLPIDVALYAVMGSLWAGRTAIRLALSKINAFQAANQEKLLIGTASTMIKMN